MDNTIRELDLCNIPAGTPPNGTSINFKNPPETQVPVLVAICVIITICTVFFTACRLFANRRRLSWSDYFVIVALILSLGNTGVMLAQAKYLRHIWDIPACWFDDRYAKLQIPNELVPVMGLFFSKASIFLLFHQLFEVKRQMRIAIRIGIIFTLLLYFPVVPVIAVLSVPHGGETWASVLKDTSRGEKSLTWGIAQSALGIILDLFIFILPLPTILKLRLSSEKKMQLVVVFTTALVGVIASILSLVYRAEALGTKDTTWKTTGILLCTHVENGVAIIVSCTPGFASFARVYISKLWIVKTLRSRLGGSATGRSSQSTKLSRIHNKDPNRPRTAREFGKVKGLFDELGDTFILKGTVSSVTATNSPQPPGSMGILRTVDVSQESHYSGSTAMVEVQEPQVRDYPTGFFLYGSDAAQPPAMSIWFYYVPTSPEQPDGPYFVPYYRSELDLSQQDQNAGSKPLIQAQEPQIQDYPNGFFYYGPEAVQPPSSSIWFYYVPTSPGQLDGPYFVPYYRSDPTAAGGYVSESSMEGGAVYSHEEV